MNDDEVRMQLLSLKIEVIVAQRLAQAAIAQSISILKDRPARMHDLRDRLLTSFPESLSEFGDLNEELQKEATAEVKQRMDTYLSGILF